MRMSFFNEKSKIKNSPVSEFKYICTPQVSPILFKVSAFSSLLRGALPTVGIFLSVTERMFKEGASFTNLLQ